MWRTTTRKGTSALLFLFFPVLLIAQNHVVNGGFDETPWDTGWTQILSGGGYAHQDSSKYYSPPGSGNLWAGCDIDHGIMGLYQEMDEVVACTCRVRYQYAIDAYTHGVHGATAMVAISVRRNGSWTTEWEKSVHVDSTCPNDHDEQLTWRTWEKAYAANEPVSGIEFLAFAAFDNFGAMAETIFWVDDVYVSGRIGTEQDQPRHDRLQLKAHPTLFSHSTFIEFDVPDGSQVSLWISDVTGKMVRTLVDRMQEPGRHGVTFDARTLPAGIYFVRLTAGDYRDIKKLICIR